LKKSESREGRNTASKPNTGHYLYLKEGLAKSGEKAKRPPVGKKGSRERKDLST